MTICSNTFMVINIFNSAALCCSLSVILGRKSLTEAPSVNIVLRAFLGLLIIAMTGPDQQFLWSINANLSIKTAVEKELFSATAVEDDWSCHFSCQSNTSFNCSSVCLPTSAHRLSDHAPCGPQADSQVYHAKYNHMHIVWSISPSSG